MHFVRILRSSNQEEFVENICSLFATDNRPINVAISGGSLLAPLAKALRKCMYTCSLGTIGLVDERIMTKDSMQLAMLNKWNAEQMFAENGLSHLSILGVPTVINLDAHVIDTVARDYESLVRNAVGSGYDMVLLGMGPDSHTASLFPKHPAYLDSLAEALDRQEKVSEKTSRLYIPVSSSPKPPPNRISLTMQALLDCDYVVFIISGKDKSVQIECVLKMLENDDADVFSSNPTFAVCKLRSMLSKQTVFVLDPVLSN